LRAREGDHQQRPEALDPGKAQSGRRHQETGGEQGARPWDPVSDQPDGERQHGFLRTNLLGLFDAWAKLNFKFGTY
jgi:hypothetical protein